MTRCPHCRKPAGMGRRGPKRFCSSACAGASYLANRTHAERVAHGREGGKTHAVVYRADVLARYAHLDRETAIWQAWKDARILQTQRRSRAKQAAARIGWAHQERA